MPHRHLHLRNPLLRTQRRKYMSTMAWPVFWVFVLHVTHQKGGQSGVGKTRGLSNCPGWPRDSGQHQLPVQPPQPRQGATLGGAELQAVSDICRMSERVGRAHWQQHGSGALQWSISWEYAHASASLSAKAATLGALQGLTVDFITATAHGATSAGNLPPMPCASVEPLISPRPLHAHGPGQCTSSQGVYWLTLETGTPPRWIGLHDGLSRDCGRAHD